MKMTRIFYRPVWTCGRYNKEHHAALMYNLLEGFCYYFEDDSADVIGEILKAERNGSLSMDVVSKATLISEESLEPFFGELMSCNLITKECPTTEGVADYRKRLSEYKCNKTQTVEKTTQEKLPYSISSAEMDYAERVGGVTNVMFELTYNCSEQCIHCYNPGATRNNNEVSHRGDREELKLEDYKHIIDELYEQGLTKVCLSGGDPFSKPIAWDIIDYLYQKGIATMIFTNGQRIVNQVDKLANYFPLVVGVSIYSGKPEDHDYITRIKGSWEKSMSVVKRLSELAVPMNIKCCVMRPNVKSYYMVADIAKQYGAVPQFEISLTDSVDGDICVSRNLRLTPELLEIVLRDDNVPLYVGKEAPNYGGQPRDLDGVACGAGDNSFCITPEGNMQPCCAFPCSFGNLKKDSLKAILQSKALKEWQNVRLKDYEECGRHDYCDYCNLCSGVNYTQHGTPLKAGENNCFIAKIRCSLAMKLKNGIDSLNGQTIQECLSSVSVHLNDLERNYEHKNFRD
jgi:radical SAM protein with 4Fe4S-binding SPASM domain